MGVSLPALHWYAAVCTSTDSCNAQAFTGWNLLWQTYYPVGQAINSRRWWIPNRKPQLLPKGAVQGVCLIPVLSHALRQMAVSVPQQLGPAHAGRGVRGGQCLRSTVCSVEGQAVLLSSALGRDVVIREHANIT